MNNATIIGLFAGLGLVALAIGLGGDASAFLNARAFLIVFGGTLAVTLISFRAVEVRDALRAAGRTLTRTPTNTRSSIEKLIHLAESSRKEGVHTLERRMKEFRSNPFL